MRPRLFFGKYSFANEGYSNTFALFPDYQHNKRIPYELKKKYSVQIDATDKSVELRVDGNVVDSRDTGIDTIQELMFEGGDWFSAGSTIFSNITLTCHAPEVDRPKKRPSPTPAPEAQPSPTPVRGILQS
ncbi:MAG TPA: hypothetical protein VG733_10470 [Chthoniobacteraceae bacterium]|nr:hypothetical protein [Chthoniobacteraceae bacterium]